MPLPNIVTALDQAIGNVDKLDKDQIKTNKFKSTFVIAAFSFQKRVVALQKKQLDLNKRLLGLKSLDADIKDYKKELSDFITEATRTRKLLKDCMPDTKSRDYFKIAENLEMVGPAATLDNERS